MTEKESSLLNYLLAHKGELISKKDILVTLWGKDDYFLGRSLDVFISRLRKHLSLDPAISIENVRGMGFRLSVNKETAI